MYDVVCMIGKDMLNNSVQKCFSQAVCMIVKYMIIY